ncbi:2-amino-4-hydroxy-6-hydroxymethyldihydropteridine diphosphokinase [Marinicella sediminis]|uniref:2-amino-4-hydroxy-6-hydroxymethyldihydropteridine pyrophosphokinase n=1 Tax=Marinicella sediminis TaxID=1792834 RepID=A0ABV7JBA6_9GAMM|nr:2-amino-4-hydroxy-6-hydroxymethyldihydropteridine diphosphokinase [Marinicella sediminis]
MHRARDQICYLGLGSNLNNPTRQLRLAINYLNRLPGCQVINTSAWYRSKPWGIKNQPDFVNAAVSMHTQKTPMQLLKLIKVIEYRIMGRQHNARWHSRVIDIDILLYDTIQLNRAELQVPHPLITQRCFVMAPLLELNPQLPTHLHQQIISHCQRHRCEEQLVKIRHVKHQKG